MTVARFFPAPCTVMIVAPFWDGTNHADSSRPFGVSKVTSS